MSKDQRNDKGQFVKGIVPWNTGLTNVNNSKPNQTSFKRGKEHPRYRPIGSERIGKDGVIEIKVSNKKWLTKHRHLWELKNGPVPKNHVVIFANGNKRDFSEDNLLLVSRAQLMSLNKNKLIKNETDLTKTGVVIADLLLATGKAKKRGEKSG